MKAHLTETLVKQIRENELIWDDLDLGFGVRRQRGNATFLVRFRKDRKRRCLILGKHGQIHTEEARQRARIILEAIRARSTVKKDWDVRRSVNGSLYFGEIAERYLNEFAYPRKKENSIRADRRNLELHILPAIGGLKLSQIDRPTLIKLHASMQSSPIAANRCLALISHIFVIATKWGIISGVSSNPCLGIDRFPEAQRERFLNTQEFTRLGHALEVASRGYKNVDWSRYSEADRFSRLSPEDWRSIAAIRLLIFTGARLGEILKMQWDWIDWELSIARLPDSKTGPKILFLPSHAIALLRELRLICRRANPSSPFVLPGARGSSNFQGLFYAWKRIRTIAHLKDLRVHDLRHIFASTAVAAGDSLYIVGRILGHSRPESTQRYAHLAIDPVRRVANRTAAKLNKLLRVSWPPSQA